MPDSGLYLHENENSDFIELALNENELVVALDDLLD